MTLPLALLCLLAAVLAAGAAALLSAWPRLPGWLIDIIRLAILLIAIFWLRSIFGV